MRCVPSLAPMTPKMVNAAPLTRPGLTGRTAKTTAIAPSAMAAGKAHISIRAHSHAECTASFRRPLRPRATTLKPTKKLTGGGSAANALPGIANLRLIDKFVRQEAVKAQPTFSDNGGRWGRVMGALVGRLVGPMVVARRCGRPLAS
jgi:hypothetical protein